jgi:lipoprotein-anchoring transpeptidase ErfK/SrfK
MLEGPLARRYAPTAIAAVAVLIACAAATALPLRDSEPTRARAPRGAAAFAAGVPTGAGGIDRHRAAVRGDGTRSNDLGGRRPEDGGDAARRPARGHPGDAAALLVEVPRAIEMTARPGAGRIVGTVPARSRYYRVPTIAWIQRTARGGAYGRLSVPYGAFGGGGWIPLDGLRRRRTNFAVRVSLTRHRIEVSRRDHVVLRAPAGTGAERSPTPRGRYFVTDRVSFHPVGSLGSFALGLSGIQPHPPPGWTGGDQLAIHGTSDPASIGRSVSAGCVRVSEATLARLRRIVGLGTPVVIGR